MVVSYFDTNADPELQYHYQTYRGFLRYVILFGLHVAVILALLAYLTV